MEFLNAKIDRWKLEDEWERHSSEHGYWSELAADLQSECEILEASIERKKANLDVEIRQDPGQFGIQKPTDTAVSAIILTQPDYNRLVDQYHAKRKLMLRAKAALSTLEHRRKALENLVELWIRDYYSDLKGPRGPQVQQPRPEELTEDQRREIRRRGIARKREQMDG